MSVKVFFGYEQIVVFVELPEFTIDYIEVFIGKVVLDQIDVVFELEGVEHAQKVGPLQLGQCYLAWPGPVDCVINSGDHCFDVARVKLFVVVQKLEARMSVHYVLE